MNAQEITVIGGNMVITNDELRAVINADSAAVVYEIGRMGLVGETAGWLFALEKFKAICGELLKLREET